jgi:NADH-quinone oxidoreductase subunit M
MREHSALLLSMVWLLPLLGSLWLRLRPRLPAPRVRRHALLIALATLALTLLVVLFSADHASVFLAKSDAQGWRGLARDYHLGADGLSALLLPVTATLGACVIVASPTAFLTPLLASRMLLSLGAVLGALLSLDALLLWIFWTLSLVPLYRDLRQRNQAGERVTRALFGVMLLGCALPFLGFVLGLAWPGTLSPQALAQGRFNLVSLAQPGAFSDGRLAMVLGSLLLLACLVRIGCFPFHLWIAPLSNHGPGPLNMVTFSTPLGIFVIARVLLPVFPQVCHLAFPYLLSLAVLSALYAAVVALGQHDLRRALGYFWMSQQGFLLAGLSSLTSEGISGALLHAIGTVIVRIGLVLIAASVAVRAGTSDVRFLGGFAARAPLMATSFLLLSIAAIGLPGTAGFVSEDLIVQGLLREHPVAAVMLLITTALNGILLFSLFVRVFLAGSSPLPGALKNHEFPEFLPRERWVSVFLIGLLLLGGVASAPLLSVRSSVVGALPNLTGIH